MTTCGFNALAFLFILRFCQELCGQSAPSILTFARLIFNVMRGKSESLEQNGRHDKVTAASPSKNRRHCHDHNLLKFSLILIYIIFNLKLGSNLNFSILRTRHRSKIADRKSLFYQQFSRKSKVAKIKTKFLDILVLIRW